MKILPPEHCPSCEEELFWENDILYCHNPLCSAKNKKQVEHFTKTLKIKGFGPSTIEKLEIESPYEIYYLSFETISGALNSEKLAEKLLEEIKKSTKCSLEEVLPALSIPLIGKTASTKLCSVIEDIHELTEEKCKEAGLGPKATENLMFWYNFIPQSTKEVVCISGRLSSYKSKAEAEKALVKMGYRVVSSVTKEVSILINESGVESSKTRKARDRGVSVVTNINQLLQE
jgi:DNA ligase (NAD+)